MKKLKSSQISHTNMVIQKNLHYKIYHTDEQDNLLEDIKSNELVASADIISTIDVGGDQIKNLGHEMRRSTVRIELNDNDNFKELDKFLRQQYERIWFDH